MKQIDEVNLTMYKQSHEELTKLQKKLMKIIPSKWMISELKKRKLLRIDWLKGEHYYDEVKN
jgi:hypothetical protein